MLKILCFVLGLHALFSGWVCTGLLLLWICFFENFKEPEKAK